jgi:hypothetical protein
MCYFLYLASPLTLSEVRSMLPAGLTADLASFAEQQTLKAIQPDAQTVIRILAGRCSCDLIRPRLGSTREDERHLRDRYRRLAVPRSLAIAALERHRRVGQQSPPGGWPRTLAAFVAEHARNAGSSLYWLSFSADAVAPAPAGEVRRVPVALVVATPEGWLPEGSPTLVLPS